MDHVKPLRMIFTAVAETKNGNAIVVFTHSFLNWAKCENGFMATLGINHQYNISCESLSKLFCHPNPTFHIEVFNMFLWYPATSSTSKWSVRLKSTKPPLRCCQASKTWASNCTKKCIGDNGVKGKEMYQFVLLHFPIKEYLWESPQEHLHTSCCSLPCMESLKKV